MKSLHTLTWFLVSMALTALLVMNWREATQQKLLLEKVQLQVEQLDLEEKTARARVGELEKETRQLRGELRAAEVEASGARTASTLALQMTNAASGRRAPDSPAQGASGMGNILANMMKDPEMRKAMEQQQRMGMDVIYGSLYKELQLTPEQEEKFKEVLVGTQMTNMMQAGALMDRSNTNRTELARKLAEDQKETQEKLKELLGEEKFGRYQDYSQTLGERMILDQFSKQTQVSADQNEQLLAIMLEEKKNMQANTSGEASNLTTDWQKLMETSEAAERMLVQQEQVNERFLERATQVLSPEQMAKLRPLMTNQIAMQRASLKMTRQMFPESAIPQPASEP